MTMRSYHGLFAFASILAGLAEPDRPLPKPLAEGTAAMLDELYTRGIDATEVLEAAGGAEHFETVARACLDMQAALKMIGIETRNPWRMLEHRHMLARQRQFADRVGSLAMASALAATGAFSATVSQFALYESRCAREASLCACGPAGVAQLAEEHRAALDRAGSRRKIDISERGIVGWFDVTTGEQELSGTAEAMRSMGMTVSADVPDQQRVTMRAPVPRGPGLLIRDARERRGWSLKYLAALLMMPAVELGEYERNVEPVPPARWEDFRRVLGDPLPEVMPAQTAPSLALGIGGLLAEQCISGADARAAIIDKALHPAGRCTCSPGGGPSCEWCRCDERRTKREDRRARRTARLQPDAPRDLLTANVVEQERKATHRKARARRKAKQGW